MKRSIATLMLLGLLYGSPASALVLCQARDHSLFARTKCHRKETLVPLTAVGVAGATGAQGTVGPRGPSAVRVIDAVGHEVGSVTNTDSFLVFVPDGSTQVTFVLLKSTPIGQPVLLGLDTAGDPTGSVSYASADCSGTPLIQGGGFLGLLQVVSDTVFYPTQPTSATTGGSIETTDRSHGCTSITTRGGCCRAQAMSITGFSEAATTTLGALGIAPPLHAVTGSP